jgi:ribosome assembly protein 1
MSSMKEACRNAFMGASSRLVEAVFKCSMQCTADQLGNLYSIINRRRGEVLKEEIWEGSTLFHIECTLPVVESFGFANDLRKNTSGAVANPQLVFSHWSLLDIDPFFQPKTLDEREEMGDVHHEGRNIAKRYIDDVRRRKGLPVDEKIVVAAEKQRNLSKNK